MSEATDSRLVAAREAFAQAAAAYQLATLDLLRVMAESFIAQSPPVEPEGTVLLTVREVAHELRIGERLVRHLIQRHELPAIHVLQEVRVRRVDLITWAAAHAEQEASAA